MTMLALPFACAGVLPQKSASMPSSGWNMMTADIETSLAKTSFFIAVGHLLRTLSPNFALPIAFQGAMALQSRGPDASRQRVKLLITGRGSRFFAV